MSEAIREIKIDENSSLLNKDGLFYREFPSDLRQVRYYAMLVVQKAPQEIKEINLFEQQVSELIKNAIKHGNKKDINKKVRIWYNFSREEARFIVEDEGDGFKDLEKWNNFNKKREEAFRKQDFIEMTNYVSWRTERSDEQDGGNALFAALEYWNGGLVFNNKKNCVGVKRIFPQKRDGHGIRII